MSLHGSDVQDAEDVVHVSSAVWSELLHAEVAYLLREAGVPVLHIKGPTVVRWLYRGVERPLGDVDVLVPASRMAEALACLGQAGMEERFPGVSHAPREDHAVALVRRQPGESLEMGAEVDVHDRFPGIEADPDKAFQELWRRREPDCLAHVDCWFPDFPSRALLLALNTARSMTPQAREDLRRLLETTDDEDWVEVIALAKRLGALPALRSGLCVDQEGVRVADRLMPDVEISTEWMLRQGGAPRTAVRLIELQKLGWRSRPGQVWRWLLPDPSIMRMRDPAARRGRIALCRAYARRLGDGVRSVPRSIAALRQARRHDRHGGGPPPGDMG